MSTTRVNISTVRSCRNVPEGTAENACDQTSWLPHVRRVTAVRWHCPLLCTVSRELFLSERAQAESMLSSQACPLNLAVWIQREKCVVTKVHYSDDGGQSNCPQAKWWSRSTVHKCLTSNPLLAERHHTATLITSEVLE